MLKRLEATPPKPAAARQRRYKWRKDHGRLVLPGVHVDDVAWPEMLVALGRLRHDQVEDRDAIRDATIRFLDEVALAEIEVRRR